MGCNCRSAKNMKICILGVSGPICSFDADDTTSVLDAKMHLRSLTSIPLREQGLIAGTDVLCDEQRLHDVATGDVMELTLVRMEVARPELLEGVAGGFLALADLSDELRCDREVVLAAVSHEGWQIEAAAPELRKDMEVALAAVT